MPSEALLEQLSRIVGPRGILTGESLRQRSTGVWGPPRTLQAGALVRPADTGEVAQVLSACAQARQPVVTQGGLSGVVDGAWAAEDEIVLSMERMQTIEEVDDIGRTMRVQAGVRLETVHDAAAASGLMFPLDLGARGSATLGGNAATNAGGNRVLRFGMARQSILGLEVVLADGTVLSSLNALLKNNAGYDLKHLFIGTEGTLGVITRLVLRLMAAPRSQQTALVAAPDFTAVAALLGTLDQSLGGQLSAFEVMWGDFYEFMAEGRGALPLDTGQAFYILLESLGGDPDGDALRFEAALAEAMDRELLTDAVIAKSDAERLDIWSIRDDVVKFWELEPMFMFDVSLPIRSMESYLDHIGDELRHRWPGCRLYTFGHLGDGNLHLAISAGDADGRARGEVTRIVYEPLGELAGSISAEHGIGLEKKPYLKLCRTAEEIELMRTLKRSLDPGNILNPGKVFDLAADA